MVAETHNHVHLDTEDIIALITFHRAADNPAQLTLAECGYDGDLGLMELVDLLGEEYGERCLAPIAPEDLQDQMTVGELIALLCA